MNVMKLFIWSRKKTAPTIQVMAEIDEVKLLDFFSKTGRFFHEIFFHSDIFNTEILLRRSFVLAMLCYRRRYVTETF
jgi:hypothetical protein